LYTTSTKLTCSYRIQEQVKFEHALLLSILDACTVYLISKVAYKNHVNTCFNWLLNLSYHSKLRTYNDGRLAFCHPTHGCLISIDVPKEPNASIFGTEVYTTKHVLRKFWYPSTKLHAITCNIYSCVCVYVCVCVYIYIYLLPLFSRVLLEKLTGFQRVKEFPAFYGTRRFITAFTSARHLSLS